MFKTQLEPRTAGEWIHCQALNILWHHFMVYKSMDHRKLLPNCFLHYYKKKWRAELALFSVQKAQLYIWRHFQCLYSYRQWLRANQRAGILTVIVNTVEKKCQSLLLPAVNDDGARSILTGSRWFENEAESWVFAADVRCTVIWPASKMVLRDRHWFHLISQILCTNNTLEYKYKYYSDTRVQCMSDREWR